MTGGFLEGTFVAAVTTAADASRYLAELDPGDFDDPAGMRCWAAARQLAMRDAERSGEHARVDGAALMAALSADDRAWLSGWIGDLLDADGEPAVIHAMARAIRGRRWRARLAARRRPPTAEELQRIHNQQDAALAAVIRRID